MDTIELHKERNAYKEENSGRSQSTEKVKEDSIYCCSYQRVKNLLC